MSRRATEEVAVAAGRPRRKFCSMRVSFAGVTPPSLRCQHSVPSLERPGVSHVLFGGMAESIFPGAVGFPSCLCPYKDDLPLCQFPHL